MTRRKFLASAQALEIDVDGNTLRVRRKYTSQGNPKACAMVLVHSQGMRRGPNALPRHAPWSKCTPKACAVVQMHSQGIRRGRRCAAALTASAAWLCTIFCAQGEPRSFSSGAMGWYLGGKVEMKIGDQDIWAQVGLNCVIPGSNAWKD
jgi:hypothetical protein